MHTVHCTMHTVHCRDGKSVNNSTDEYLVPKNSTKTRILRNIAICAKTAKIPLNQAKLLLAHCLQHCPQGKVQNKKSKKKLTSVSFMYVCVAENAELLVFSDFFFAPSP